MRTSLSFEGEVLKENNDLFRIPLAIYVLEEMSISNFLMLIHFNSRVKRTLMNF